MTDKQTRLPARRYYRKRVALFRLIDKVKLWPSRTGMLHGIKTIEKTGDQARLTTHCNKMFSVSNSRNSRAARWLRNKWYKSVCPQCRIPQWKIEKYAATEFSRHYGSDLTPAAEEDR